MTKSLLSMSTATLYIFTTITLCVVLLMHAPSCSKEDNSPNITPEMVCDTLLKCAITNGYNFRYDLCVEDVGSVREKCTNETMQTAYKCYIQVGHECSNDFWPFVNSLIACYDNNCVEL